MSGDEIIRMAREAGFSFDSPGRDFVDAHTLERFAALVATAEREACAKVCEAGGGFQDGYSCAAAIRERRDPPMRLNDAAEDNGEPL